MDERRASAARTCIRSAVFRGLEIGDTIVGEPAHHARGHRAPLSGDHLRAHGRCRGEGESFFEDQVAHGYFIVSMAGLFVDPARAVLANYGLSTCYAARVRR